MGEGVKIGFEPFAKDIRRLLIEELPAILEGFSDGELTVEPFKVCDVAVHVRDDWPNCEIQYIATRLTDNNEDDDCIGDESDMTVEHEFTLDVEIIGDGDDEAIPLYFKVSRYAEAIRAALRMSRFAYHFTRDVQLTEFGALQDSSSILMRRFTMSIISRSLIE
jgi:hypothetical protein